MAGSDRIHLMELYLAYPFPLCQLLERRQVLPRVFNTARHAIAHELKNELDALQSWVEAHQEQWIEFRLEGVCVDDLVVALLIVDLSVRERIKHHQIQRALVLGFL